MYISELTSLQKTLNDAIDTFKAELAAQNLSEPSLYTSKPHPIDDIAYLPTPAMYEARRAALASLGLIKSLIQSPYDALASNACMVYEAAGVRLTAEIGLATILGDSEEGLTIAEIAEKTDVDGLKLERVLRLLITQGYFREPKAGCFANNRLSNLIKKDQPGFHLATYMNDLSNKVSVSFSEMINHPDQEFRLNNDPHHTAFQLAYKTDVAYFGANGWLTMNPQEAIKFSLGCFLIIDTVIQPAVTSSKGQDFVESLLTLNKEVYQPLPPPPFVPIDFGDASRIQHLVFVNSRVAIHLNRLAFERTLPQLEEMIELGGMKIKNVHATRGWASIIEVVPV